MQLHLQMRLEELLLDEVPDDSGHLIAEHLHQGSRGHLAHGVAVLIGLVAGLVGLA